MTTRKRTTNRVYSQRTVLAAYRRLLRLCYQSLRYENQDRLLAIGSGRALWTYGEIRHHLREALKLKVAKGGKR